MSSRESAAGHAGWRRDMFALPPALEADGREHVTGLACPDCRGVLRVRRESDHALLTFVCRIGHLFSLEDLLAAKESALEDRLWDTIVALEEIVALLHDLDVQGQPPGRPPLSPSWGRRAARAVAHLERLRQIVKENVLVDLSSSPGG